MKYYLELDDWIREHARLIDNSHRIPYSALMDYSFFTFKTQYILVARDPRDEYDGWIRVGEKTWKPTKETYEIIKKYKVNEQGILGVLAKAAWNAIRGKKSE